MKLCKVCGKEGEFRKWHNRCKKCTYVYQAEWRRRKSKPKIGTDFDIDIEEPTTDPFIEIPADAFADLAPKAEETAYMPDFEGLQRLLIIPDCHWPFEHKANFQLMLRAARAFRPDITVLMGDAHDFYAVNAHGKRPDRNGLLKWEVEQSRPRLLEVEALSSTKRIYIMGNHENRFERYIENRAPDLFGMTTVEKILQLDKWTCVPYKQSFKIGKVDFTHDVGTAGRNAARQAMDAFQGSAVIGHTHRMGLDYMGSAGGMPSIGAHFGWLGDPVHAEYMHRIQAQRNWMQGFGIGWMRPNGVIHFAPCPIVGGAVVIDGRLIT